jgi:hypothetical protein
MSANYCRNNMLCMSEGMKKSQRHNEKGVRARPAQKSLEDDERGQTQLPIVLSTPCCSGTAEDTPAKRRLYHSERISMLRAAVA